MRKITNPEDEKWEKTVRIIRIIAWTFVGMFLTATIIYNTLKICQI
jgi:hypothetical protein